MPLSSISRGLDACVATIVILAGVRLTRPHAHVLSMSSTFAATAVGASAWQCLVSVGTTTADLYQGLHHGASPARAVVIEDRPRRSVGDQVTGLEPRRPRAEAFAETSTVVWTQPLTPTAR
jgi:hypothetical protein